MPRLRSVLVVALIWVGAFAATSAPDGFGGAARAATNSVGGALSRASDDGKRWAVIVAPATALDLPYGANGKRWG